MISAPYNFRGAPVEMFFAALKACELNPGSHPTGKRYALTFTFNFQRCLLELRERDPHAGYKSQPTHSSKRHSVLEARHRSHLRDDQP